MGKAQTASCPRSGQQFSVSSLLIVLLGFAACGGGGGDDIPGGSIIFDHLPTNYEISYCEINKEPAVPWTVAGGRIQPANGDAYYYGVIAAGSRRSYAGGAKDPYNKASLYSNTYTKDPSNEWKLSNNPADLTFTGETSVYAIFNKIDAPQPSPSVSMGYNKVYFSGGHAVIDFNASSFTIPETSGRFTLTGIPAKHNGKHAILIGAYGNPPTALYGLKDATSATAFKGYPITGGTAEIPVFKLNVGDLNFSSFDEDPSVTSLVIIIQDEEEFDFLEYTEGLLVYPPVTPPSLVYTYVQFTDGKASRAYDPAIAVGGL